MHEDGTGVSLHIAAAEIGQGSDTVMVQIAAEELGIPYEQVSLVDCDTVLSTLDLGAYSSRLTWAPHFMLNQVLTKVFGNKHDRDV